MSWIPFLQWRRFSATYRVWAESENGYFRALYELAKNKSDQRACSSQSRCLRSRVSGDFLAHVQKGWPTSGIPSKIAIPKLSKLFRDYLMSIWLMGVENRSDPRRSLRDPRGFATQFSEPRSILICLSDEFESRRFFFTTIDEFVEVLVPDFASKSMAATLSDWAQLNGSIFHTSIVCRVNQSCRKPSLWMNRSIM